MYCVFVAILFVVVRNVGMYEIDKVVEEVKGGGIIQRFFRDQNVWEDSFISDV